MNAPELPPEEEQEPVATTIAEAAEHFGVSPRTFANWMKTPGFPGKPGSPGKRDGHFPLDQIEQWKETQPKKGGTANDDEELSIRREMLLIERDKKRAEFERDILGTLIDGDEVVRFMEFTIAAANQKLQELPDLLEKKLPSRIRPKLMKLIRKVAAEAAIDVLESLSQIIRGDSDDKEDDE